MDQEEQGHVAENPLQQDRPRTDQSRLIDRAVIWAGENPFRALLVCLAPAILAILFPNFWIQLFCLLWGLFNLVILSRVLLVAKELPSYRRLIVSFAAIIAVTQMFGAAYAATLLTSESYRHFRFTPYSTAADFNNRRLAVQILADTHAQATRRLNGYVAWQVELGKPTPAEYPFDVAFRNRPCPNDGVVLLVFYTCNDPPEKEPIRTALYKAERWFDALFEIEPFSDEMSIMKTGDSRGSVVAAMYPNDAKKTFFELSGGALLTFFYRLENEDRTSPTRADRRAMIEYLSDIAKTTIRDFGFEDSSLLPNDNVFAYNRSIVRIETAVADALLCAQYPYPDFNDGPCEPVGEFAQWVADDGWESPEAKPRAILSSLQPLDLLFTAYLTEVLYWDIKSMESSADRRDLVINGIMFSAMAVMTSGFADMSPVSYLAKSLLIFQFLAYVLLIILILPMSFERPKED